MLFCLWDQNFSFKQKVGILIGVTLQIFSGMIQVIHNEGMHTNLIANIQFYFVIINRRTYFFSLISYLLHSWLHFFILFYMTLLFHYFII